MPRFSAQQGWQFMTHTMSKQMPLDLYRARRARRSLMHITRKVKK